MIADTTPQLLLYTSDGVEQRPLVGQEIWTLGRHNNNDIQLPERSVSREHARLECAHNKHFIFFDLGSSNGSVVNEQPVYTPVLLKHGDRLKLGNMELAFEHRLVLNGASTAEQLADPVLLLQASALQGKIWQEVLLSQGLSVIWAAPDANLQQVIKTQLGSSNKPRVCLLDLQAYQQDIEAFCRWCQTYAPHLTLLLVDSAQRQISVADRQWAQDLGCVHFLPAFRTPKLLDNVAGVVVHLNLVLQAFDNRLLHQHKLFLALNNLEDLMQRVPCVVGADAGSAAPFRAPTAEQSGGVEEAEITTISAVRSPTSSKSV